MIKFIIPLIITETLGNGSSPFSSINAFRRAKLSKMPMDFLTIQDYLLVGLDMKDANEWSIFLF